MFNPEAHLTKLPQGKDRDGNERTADYLEVKYRLVWFREQCPEGTIDTEEILVDLDRVCSAEAWVWNSETRKKEKVIKQAKGYARYKAIVTDGKGGRASAHKSESAVNFDDFIEKAETGSVGRALAMLGYGTQFTGDELAEDHRIVDSPVERSNGKHNGNGHKPHEEQEPASPAPDDAPTPAQLRARHKEIGLQMSFEQIVEKCFNRTIADDELTPTQCVHLSKVYDRKAREKASTQPA